MTEPVDNIETIRAAIAPNATAEAREAGAVACRAVLAVLDPAPAQPPAIGGAAPPSPITGIVAALRGASPDQLLDLAIGRLRSALPPGVTLPTVEPLKFHIVPVPHRG